MKTVLEIELDLQEFVLNTALRLNFYYVLLIMKQNSSLHFYFSPKLASGIPNFALRSIKQLESRYYFQQLIREAELALLL